MTKRQHIERVPKVFVETTIFTSQLKGLLTVNEHRQLQNELVENSESGNLISGDGGIRKIRVSYGDKGKSGGARAIYYFRATDDQIYMLVIYPKSVKDNLSAAEKAILKELVKSL
ncbi:type II toxin-antitoxin system RelE/ParE family toxin [Undibacterium sp. TS12]|uniref:type II toxin-antitoxin system RelE/ParE family toxin n=1 Tax=Undibacterium sp. TS12 TaxID=2908202 RepID=UPI001F4C771F|nr:type II toxin-antitoxin system RelE/ParE family toxin [Undibacterium sp. TS12]MCH8619600.1 type II toxin-antitoxin system RelE/ParE family toxin [Undibacterium sp. TS12]